MEAHEFANCISTCALQELKFKGRNFTWWSRRIEGDIVKRLDRVLINQEFLDIFATSKVHHLIREGSNHVLFT